MPPRVLASGPKPCAGNKRVRGWTLGRSLPGEGKGLEFCRILSTESLGSGQNKTHMANNMPGRESDRQPDIQLHVQLTSASIRKLIFSLPSDVTSKSPQFTWILSSSS